MLMSDYTAMVEFVQCLKQIKEMFVLRQIVIYVLTLD